MQKQPQKTLRIAVYVRMAKTEDSILHEESLKQYYINQIGSIPDGTLADFYIDEKSGSNRERPALQRLLVDCQAGKVDQVMTKSVTTLGRNLADVQSLCCEMKNYGVTIYFEKERRMI